MSLAERGATISVGGKGIHERDEEDFYVTQPKMTNALLDNLILSESILEPACGQGHISR